MADMDGDQLISENFFDHIFVCKINCSNSSNKSGNFLNFQYMVNSKQVKIVRAEYGYDLDDSLTEF